MCYADYDYYINDYRGRQSPRQTLPVCLGQASAYLDILTLDKITDDWTTDERVKNACCAVADVYAKQDAGGEVASESNHGVSRTYVASVRAQTSSCMMLRCCTLQTPDYCTEVLYDDWIQCNGNGLQQISDR